VTCNECVRDLDCCNGLMPCNDMTFAAWCQSKGKLASCSHTDLYATYYVDMYFVMLVFACGGCLVLAWCSFQPYSGSLQCR